MPFPLAAVLGGMNTASSIFNTVSQTNANNANIQFQRETNQQNRNWAVEDWNKQNAYNSPAAQMQRFKDAGLNPNLIYGQSNTASPVRSSDSQAPKVSAPQINPGLIDSMLQGFLSMYDLQKTQAQTDNIKAQSELVKANTRLSTIKSGGAEFDLAMKHDTRDFLLENLAGKNKLLGKEINLADLKAGKLKADTSYTLAQNERAAASTAQSIAESIERIASMRIRNSKMSYEKALINAQIDNLQKSGVLMKLDADLKRLGIQPNDPAWARVTARLLNGEADKIVSEIKEGSFLSDVLKPLVAQPGGWQKKKK